MTPRKASILAWSLVGSSVVAAVVGIVVGAVGGASGSAGDVANGVAAVLVFLAVAVVGGLVASRQPRNPIGWALCGFSVFVAVSAVAAGYAEAAPGEAREGLGRWAAWFANWSYVSFFVLAIFLLLYFPDGRLLSPRWRAAAWGGGVGIAAFAAGTAFEPGHLHDYPEIENPVRLDRALIDAIGTAGMLLTIAGLVAGAAAVVIRYRRSSGLERQQITWLAFAAVVAVVAIVVGGTIGGLGREAVGNTVILVGMLAIPVAIGIAMLRYRLYEIDRIVSRTVSYAGLTLVLGASYVGLVLAGQALFSSFAGGSNLAIAVSTLVVAALFLPLRARIRRIVDRRFYRRRYDAQRTLDAFGARLREELDLETLAGELRAAVADTMQPTHASLWLRRPAA